MESGMLQRGHCCACGQQWVLGKVDPDVGVYGSFFCAACWDKWTDMETTDEDNTNEEEVPPPKEMQDLLRAAQDFLQIRDPDALEVGNVRVGYPERNRSLHMVTDNLNGYFRSCGASLWLGAQVLLNYMEQELARSHPNGLEGVRILELGAGCGLPGIGLAQLGAEVLLTDKEELCPLLECNVALNFPEGTKKPKVAPLTFGNRDDLNRILEIAQTHGGFDYIIASEIGYDDRVHTQLLKTLDRLEGVRSSAEKAAAAAGVPSAEPAPTRVIFALARRQNELDEFIEHAWEENRQLNVSGEVDLESCIGDPSCSPICILEGRNHAPRRSPGVAARTRPRRCRC